VVIDFDRIAAALGHEDAPLHDPYAVVRHMTREVWPALVDYALRLAAYGDEVWIIQANPSPADVARYLSAGARVHRCRVDPALAVERAKRERPSWVVANIQNWKWKA